MQDNPNPDPTPDPVAGLPSGQSPVGSQLRGVDPSPASMVPPEAPLAMPAQAFNRRFRDESAPCTPDADPQTRHVALWRWLAFSPAMLATLALAWVMQGWFAVGGTTVLETVLLVLIAFNFFWICFTVSTVLLGLVSLTRSRPRVQRGPRRAMNVALLVPVYNEVPWYVLGNARSMLEELRAIGGAHRFEMFILSDTRDPEIAARKRQASQPCAASCLAISRSTIAAAPRTRHARSAISMTG